MNTPFKITRTQYSHRSVRACIVFTMLALLSIWAAASDLPQITVKGLFKNTAILVIDGQQVVLKSGERKSGITLVSASSKNATIEHQGKHHTLLLSQSIGGSYTVAKKAEIRLSSQHNGHYFGTALINGRRGHFVVDTGASSVAMSSYTAKQLGIKYLSSKTVSVSTAQGLAKGYRVNLKKVEVGAIKINNVAAIVIEGRFPEDILLGNSFLSQTEMTIDNGVLLLQKEY